MTYHNAIKFIKSAPTSNPEASLYGRIKLICEKLGNPQKRLSYIRLAGSNGKTVCAEMLMSVLNAAGHTVGCLYMPVRDDIKENIRIGTENLSIEDTVDYMSKVHNAVAEIKKERLAQGDSAPFEPTGSELLLALSLLVFKEKHCSLCIIEGDHSGEDPSKFLPPPRSAIICGTIPSSEREEIMRIRSYICHGIEEIVSSPQSKEAFRVISDTCVSVNCRLTIPSRNDLSPISSNLGGSKFKYKGKEYSISLCGSFQIYNTILVLEAINMLVRCGIDVSEKSIISGLSSLKLRSRFEPISTYPFIIADSTYKSVAIPTVCDSLSELRTITGNAIKLCLPNGKIVDEYVRALSKRGYDIKQIFVLDEEAPENEDGIKIYRKSPKRLSKAALCELSRDEILLISGRCNFTDKVRYEILSILGF